MRRLRIRGFPCLLAAAMTWLAAPAGRAQETRGSFQGKIQDNSGAVIPGARVTATNVGTNVALTTKSNAEGAYNLLFLAPGVYNLTANASGFKTTRRDNLQLPIHERVQVDFILEVGEVMEQVQVSAQAPLLQTSNANLGTVIDSRRVSELPTIHGSPFSLIYLSAGILYGLGNTSAQQSPQALTADSDFLSINGAPAGTTDYTIDGVPNTQTSNVGNGAGASNSPPADLVQEFKLETAFDASFGRTSGTVMNVSIKTGTNTPHGTAYIFDREPSWSANSFFGNRVGSPLGNFTYKRWGASLLGPVYIPKVYNGKDRTFFSYGYEGLHVTNVAVYTGTVPDAKSAGGDFSNLLALGSQYQIYDPATIQAAANNRFSAQPFAGNIIPASRINPISKSLLALYPSPSGPGRPDGVNNFVQNRPAPETYYNHTSRIDHQISDKQRMYGRFAYVHRLTGPYRFNWDGPATGNTFYGNAPQVALDDVYVLNPSTVFNFRYGFIRYAAGHKPLGYGFDVGGLGFPAQTISQLTGVFKIVPNVTITGVDSIGSETTDYVNSDSHSFFGSVTKQYGSHNIKAGVDIRVYRETMYSYGRSGGSFAFDTTYTRGPLDTSPTSPGGIGQGLAAFLLGAPTTGTLDRNDSQASQSTYWGLYVHDNWRVSQKLTIDVGLRWEYEGPTTERFNRAVRGFNVSAAQPIEAQVKANYALRPDAALLPDSLRVRGGLLFAGVNGVARTFWDRSFHNFAPRLGFAYHARPRAVLRGGFGIFPIQIGETAVNRPIQTGFSQSTPLVPTLDNGQHFIANLANPYPSGVLLPTGASLGAATFLGRALTAYNTPGATHYDMHWDVNTQFLLPAQTLLEVGYHGSRTVRLLATRNFDALPNQYLSTSPFRDQATINYLNGNVSNPFAGLLPNTALNGPTIARSQLLLPYPQFTGINVKDYQGYSWYHALQVRLERRFSHGFTTQVGYAYAKLREATVYLNPGDPRPFRTIGVYDRPQQISFSGIWELPFGSGRRLLSGGGRLTNRIVGGWQIGSVFQFISGSMADFTNVLFYGNSANIILPAGQRTIDRWFNTDAGFERDSTKQLASNLRQFPLRFSSLRGAPKNTWDLSLLKNTKIYERYEFQFRFEAFNALNHAVFASPNVDPTSTNFGRITATTVLPRSLELGFKLVF